MLTKRQKQVLLYLINSKESVSGKCLAKECCVSVKTIQRDIRDMNAIFEQDNVEIESLKGFGYKISDDAKRILMDTFFYNHEQDRQVIPDTKEARLAWIIRYVSHATLYGQYPKVQELSDSLYVSEATVQRYLSLVRFILKDYGLVLVNRDQTLQLVGEEVDVRRLINDYLIDDRNKGSLDRIYSNNPYKTQHIKAIVNQALQDNDVVLTDVGFVNLIMHLEIALMRIEQGNFDTEHIDIEPDENDDIERCANQIGRELSQALQLEIPQQEISNIYIHLISQKKFYINEVIELPMDDPIHQLIDQTLQEVYQIYSIDYRNDNVLMHGLSVHLESALHRIRYGFTIQNELLEEIKKNYSFDMQIANILAHHIESHFEMTLNQDEIGFLALHFSGAHERTRERVHTMTRVMLVCTTGIGTALLLKAKLQAQFKQDIEIVRVCSYMEYQAQRYTDIDLIVSTITIPAYDNIPVVVTSAMMTGSDTRNIEQAIVGIYAQNDVLSLFNENHYISLNGCQNREEALKALTNKAFEMKVMDQACIASVNEREALGSTEIGNGVAIPHNMSGTVYHSTIVVGISDTPINWEHGQVSLVFLILLDETVKRENPHIFETIYRTIDTPTKVEQILNIRSYDSFIKLLKEEI